MTDRRTKELEGMIQNSVSVSRVTNNDSDKDLDSVIQVMQNGKPSDALCVMPYGLSANVPKGALVITLSNNASSDSKIGIPSFPENRFRDLREWEVKVGNFKTKAHVHFNDDGEIVFKVDNLTASDDYAVKYNKLKEELDKFKTDFNDFVSIFNNHTQAVSGAPPVAAVPTIKASQTSFDISSSKVEKVRLP